MKCRGNSWMLGATALVLAAGAARGQVVISEVYGGGGNSGATYRNDYVELFNRGSSSVAIGGWSVQYASATGTTWSTVVIPAGAMLGSGQYYLVQLASGGATGALLPTANATGTINMSGVSGKVALCNSSAALSGACPASAAIKDFVGYGSANCAEGTTAPTLTNTTAAQRDGGGCEDTGSNSANFSAAAPTPRNMASPLAPCGGGGGTPLRIASWNVTAYTSNAARDAAYKTVLYGSYSGRQFAPDVLAAQEFGSSANMNLFLSNLNSAAGSPGDWAAAAFVDGNDLDNVFFYRTSRVTYVGSTVIAVGTTGATDQVRNTMRYDFRPAGLAGASNTIAIYNSHMKAGSASSDQARRLVEASRIRDNAEGVNTNGAGSGLPSGYNFMVVGDFNMQSSSQTAFAELVGSQANNTGRFFDLIATSGSWNNNAAYKFVFTQEPKAAMDDRLDFMLVGASLKDLTGIDYIGNTSLAFSTTTWNDPNHSFRTWGNDGTSFNTGIAVATNSMVGPTIAQAIKDSCGTSATGGHLPIFADFTVPASGAIMAAGGDPANVDDAVEIDLGRIAAGRKFDFPLQIANDADVNKWGERGAASIVYTLESGNAHVPRGVFAERAGGALNVHPIEFRPSQVGHASVTVWVVEGVGAAAKRRAVIFSMDVFLPGDMDGDGVLGVQDAYHVVEAATSGHADAPVEADADGDGEITLHDAVAVLGRLR